MDLMHVRTLRERSNSNLRYRCWLMRETTSQAEVARIQLSPHALRKEQEESGRESDKHIHIEERDMRSLR